VADFSLRRAGAVFVLWEVLKLTVEDVFLFQPLKSRKDAKGAVFFGGFSRLFAVKINFYTICQWKSHLWSAGGVTQSCVTAGIVLVLLLVLVLFPLSLSLSLSSGMGGEKDKDKDKE
jgi:hypothetical protein